MNTTRPPFTISLCGSDWRIQPDPDGDGASRALYNAEIADWLPATVPGNIQADLEAAHALQPLWYGAGDPRLHAAAKQDWWYRRDFQLPEAAAGKRLQLVFDGVDHACEVWLNGERLGENAGMFRRFAFDVAGIVNAGETNRLAVKIERIPPELERILEASDGAMSGGGENYPTEWGDDFFVHGINQTRQRLQELKSPTNFGWDWGVNIYTLGIWQEARLEATGSARIEWLRVQSELRADYRQATIRVQLDIDSQSAIAAEARFRIHCQGQDLEASVAADLRPGHNIIQAALTVDAPALWWPNGHGEQPLYALEARLQAANGELLDARSTRFGIREIRWEQTAGAPADFINPYQLVVNGRKIRMLGSNLLPPDLLFGRMNERGIRLIQLTAEAGMNALRVWGGGVFPSDAMFDLADELGIMIVQEFPLASCAPETDPVFLRNLESTVRQLIQRARNHPCIVEWSGGNEMWWASGDEHAALQLLERIVDEEDDRLFRATCPIQGSRHSPWHYDPETHYALFDDDDLPDNGRHPGDHWVMRYGEFGCHSLAHLEVWQREIPPADLRALDDVNNPVLIRKNLAQAVFTKEHWLLKPILASLFGELTDLEDLVRTGQFLGAHGLRYAVDALRRRGGRLGGLTTWCLNEPWPNGGGPYLIDYDGRPLMIYEFLRDALAPVALSLKSESNLFDPAAALKAELWLVSDAPDSADDLRWSWLIRDRRGAILAEDSGSASIEPMEAIALGQIESGPLDEAEAGPLLVELRLSDAAGEILAERAHVFGNAATNAPLAGLLPNHARSVAQTRLRLVGRQSAVEADSESLTLSLRNDGAMTALFCEPQPLLAYRTDLSIDGNYRCIPPGETRSITIRGPRDSRDGFSLAQTGWRVACWNAAALIVPPSDDVLLSIGRRDSMCREFLPSVESASHNEQAIAGKVLEPKSLNHLLRRGETLWIVFTLAASPESAARLRLHSADQDSQTAPQLHVELNGAVFSGALPTGLGIQEREPEHLAFPQTLEFRVPSGTLRAGRNRLRIRLENQSWLTWDSMDLVAGA